MPINPNIPLMVGQGVPAIQGPFQAMKDVMALQQAQQQLELQRQSVKDSSAYREALNAQREATTRKMRQDETNASRAASIYQSVPPAEVPRALAKAGLFEESEKAAKALDAHYTQAVNQKKSEYEIRAGATSKALQALRSVTPGNQAAWEYAQSALSELGPQDQAYLGYLKTFPADANDPSLPVRLSELRDVLTDEKTQSELDRNLWASIGNKEQVFDAYAKRIASTDNDDQSDSILKDGLSLGALTREQAGTLAGAKGRAYAQKLTAPKSESGGSEAERAALREFGPNYTVAQLARVKRSLEAPAGAGETGTWTDTGRVDAQGNAIYVNNKTTGTKTMPFGAKQTDAGAEAIAKKRQAVVEGTHRTLDAIDEIIDESGSLRPSMLAALGKSRVSMLHLVPGTEAFDANASINRLRSRLVIDLMAEMKAQSRTGATGFGQLNMQELKILMDSAAKLDPKQSEEVFAIELRKIRDRLEKILKDPMSSKSPSGDGGAIATPKDDTMVWVQGADNIPVRVSKSVRDTLVGSKQAVDSQGPSSGSVGPLGLSLPPR
jgi:hypothetical protein